MTSDGLVVGPYSLGQIALVVLATGAVFGALDFAWLSYAGKAVYMSTLGPIMAPTPRFGAMILFYVLYFVGLLYFVVLPFAPSESGARPCRRPCLVASPMPSTI